MDLALKILDGAPLRPGGGPDMLVTRAKFEQKGMVQTSTKLNPATQAPEALLNFIRHDLRFPTPSSQSLDLQPEKPTTVGKLCYVLQRVDRQAVRSCIRRNVTSTTAIMTAVMLAARKRLVWGRSAIQTFWEMMFAIQRMRKCPRHQGIKLVENAGSWALHVPRDEISTLLPSHPGCGQAGY